MEKYSLSNKTIQDIRKEIEDLVISFVSLRSEYMDLFKVIRKTDDDKDGFTFIGMDAVIDLATFEVMKLWFECSESHQMTIKEYADYVALEGYAEENTCFDENLYSQMEQAEPVFRDTVSLHNFQTKARGKVSKRPPRSAEGKNKRIYSYLDLHFMALYGSEQLKLIKTLYFSKNLLANRPQKRYTILQDSFWAYNQLIRRSNKITKTKEYITNYFLLHNVECTFRFSLLSKIACFSCDNKYPINTMLPPLILAYVNAFEFTLENESHINHSSLICCYDDLIYAAYHFENQEYLCRLIEYLRRMLQEVVGLFATKSRNHMTDPWNAELYQEMYRFILDNKLFNGAFTPIESKYIDYVYGDFFKYIESLIFSQDIYDQDLFKYARMILADKKYDRNH